MALEPFVYLCCHRVTNRPIGKNGAHHPSLTGLCGFVLDCGCMKNGKKGEVEIPIQFHTSTPCKLPAQHRTAAALLPLCCCCLLRLKTVLMRVGGKLWSPWSPFRATVQQYPGKISHAHPESLIYGITSKNQCLNNPIIMVTYD